MMRPQLRILVIGLLAAFVFLSMHGGVSAQSISVQWDRWDDDITVSADNSSQAQIVESQSVTVISGTIHKGTRNWDTQVTVQSVSFMSGDSKPQAMAQGTVLGDYQVTSDASGLPLLTYYFPNPITAGSSFTVKITYTAPLPSAGLLAWYVVPENHAFPVNSSTAIVHFADGQAPDSSLVRITEGTGNVTANGNTMVIQSSGIIPANQGFAIQLPFGVGVNGNNNAIPTPYSYF